MGTFFNETYRESEWAFPFASLLFFKGSVWEWGSFSNQKKKNVTVSLTHLIPCDRCRMEGKGEQNFHPFLFPLSSLHFTLPPALHGIENRESVETGKFFKSGKEGAFSIPIPAPVQGKGKGIYRHGVFFSNERYREREGRVSLPSLSPI